MFNAGRYVFEVKNNLSLFLVLLLFSTGCLTAEKDLSSALKEKVNKVYKHSLSLRKNSLTKTISKDKFWIKGPWGDTLWSLAALYLDEKVDSANERLFNLSKAYIQLSKIKEKNENFTPENFQQTPWGYFGLCDYVRILYLFHSNSKHFPGRLNQQTEAAMKEALWLWVKNKSKAQEATVEDLFTLYGTENHDLTLRPNYYLVTAFLKDDPVYKNRLLDDGFTPVDHAEAYTKFYREWPRQRAMTGLWVEIGSNTYQKYSWPSLVNLYDLSPDKTVRQQFKKLMNLAFIEEAQISVKGRRGGGRSRAQYGANPFEQIKNLYYADSPDPVMVSHSKVFETSDYKLPAAAILLRQSTFPLKQPILIKNKVLGERLKPDQVLKKDSALVNYVYRTPEYLIGSTLQNPSLAFTPEGGKPDSVYAGISRQKRWCGVLFEADEIKDVCAVFPKIEKARGGRSQHPYWSAQHKEVILLERVLPQTKTTLGSYSTAHISMVFDGKIIEKNEQRGWIFVKFKKGYTAVKFLDGNYQWDASGKEAIPENFNIKTDRQRILLHACGISDFKNFKDFQKYILQNPLEVTEGSVSYKFNSNTIKATVLNTHDLESYRLPQVNGQEIELQPKKVWSSPFMNADFGSDKISINVGEVKQIIDFSYSH